MAIDYVVRLLARFARLHYALLAAHRRPGLNRRAPCPTLGRIALGGIGVGVVSLSLAWTIGGRELRNTIAERDFSWRSCDDGKVAVAGPERHLPWTGDDTISLAMSVPVRLVPGTAMTSCCAATPETIAHLDLSGGRLRADCRNLPDRQTMRSSCRRARCVTCGSPDRPRPPSGSSTSRALALTVSGSGHVQAQGTVERMTVTIPGSGDVRLGDLAMKRLTTRIAGSGNLEAGPKEEADITISGSGNVRLLSRPATLNTKIAGSGRITQPPVEAADRK